MNLPFDSIAEAINNASEIKQRSIYSEVEKICLNAGLLSTKDIDGKTKLYLWVRKIVELNLTTLSILRQTVSYCPESKNNDEVVQIIVRDIATRVIRQPHIMPSN